MLVVSDKLLGEFGRAIGPNFVKFGWGCAKSDAMLDRCSMLCNILDGPQWRPKDKHSAAVIDQ